MHQSLYLDYARFGLATPSALVALTDFGRLTTEVGFGMYYQRFLQEGFDGCSAAFQRRYQGLRHWQGVRQLKGLITELAGLCQSKVVLASRSTALMTLAARRLSGHCRRILVSDLAWPGYLQVLSEQARGGRAEIVSVALRHAIVQQFATTGDVVEALVERFLVTDCDGLFLPAISHDGIALPLAAILKKLREVKPGVLIVVDGAQHFAHVPHAVPQACDFYIAGAHKWLGGGTPLWTMANRGARSRMTW